MAKSTATVEKEIDWRKQQIWTIDELAQYLQMNRRTIQTYLSRFPRAFPPRLKGLTARWDKDIAIRFFQENSFECRRYSGRPRKR